MPIDNGVSLPIFQPDQFTCPLATYQSLAVLPPLSFDNKTLCDLNPLYSQLDGELTTKLHDVCKNIAMLGPITASTLNDVFTHLALSLTFLQTLIFIILLFLPALFFSLKYRCHYSNRISSHSVTATAEMLSQHGWRHLLKPISFYLLYCFWHLSVHRAYIYNLVFHSLHSLVFPVSQCVPSSGHLHFFITSGTQTWQISLLEWPVSNMGTAHSTPSEFLSLLSVLDLR